MGAIVVKAVASWAVRYTLPKDETKGRRWAVNANATVISATAADAIRLLQEVHVDAVVHGIVNRGTGDTLIADADFAESIVAAKEGV